MTCTVEGCTKPTRKGGADLCAMHYHRQYRHGSVYAVSAAQPVVRYKQRAIAGHPLAGSENKVYVHRVVLYDAIGEGPHPCHWCSRELRWMAKAAPPWPDDYLAVDHLNGDRHDNRLDNLVPSCQPCNSFRAQRAKHERLVAMGFWSNHDTVGKLGRKEGARFAS